jgi:hypothetical protein
LATFAAILRGAQVGRDGPDRKTCRLGVREEAARADGGIALGQWPTWLMKVENIRFFTVH